MVGRSRRAAGAAAALVLVLAGVGCSDDDEDDAVETEEDASGDAAGTVEEGDDSEDEGDAAGGGGEAGVIEVTARDYEFEGLPDTVADGSTFSLTTAEEGEPHELVVIKLPDDETRSIDDLIELPEAEIEPLFAGLQFVTIAMPGTTDTPGVVEPAGGTAAVSGAGRYIYVCSFPQGTTAEDVANAQGPLEGDTPPHFVLGMRGEFTVE